MKNPHNIKVGQEVLVVRLDIRGRDEGNTSIQKVTEVGRKYFKVENPSHIRFYLETLKQDTEYSASYAIWLSEEKYKEEKEMDMLSGKVASAFRGYGKLPFTLDQLRRIHAILQEGKA